MCNSALAVKAMLHAELLSVLFECLCLLFWDNLSRSKLLPLSQYSLFHHPYNPVSALALVLAPFCVKWARKLTFLGKGKG